MTTAIAKAKISPQLPAALLDDLKSEALKIEERIGAPTGDFITVTRNKTFRMPGTDAEAPEIRAVVVHWVTLHQYYKGKFDPKDPKPPVCVAAGLVPKELKPWPEVPERQHDNCADCPKNQWEDGKKQCKNQYQLALLPVDDPLADFMLLKVSPTGLKHFDKYVHKITKADVEVPHPIAVITRMYCDPTSEYASVRFDYDGVNLHVEEMAKRRREALARLLTPPTFTIPVPTVAKK